MVKDFMNMVNTTALIRRLNLFLPSQEYLALFMTESLLMALCPDQLMEMTIIT